MSIRTAIREIVQSGRKTILNLADVNYIDSVGVGGLVSTFTTVVNAGGT